MAVSIAAVLQQFRPSTSCRRNHYRTARNDLSPPNAPQLPLSAMTALTVGARGVDHALWRNYEQNSDRVNASIERLSTGKRINRPKDDPAGFVAVAELRKELQDLNTKLKGISRERQQSHVQQSGLANIQTALLDLRGRIEDAAGGFITAEQRSALESEIDLAADAVNRVAKLTNTNDVVSIDSNTLQALLPADAASAAVIEEKSDAVLQQRTELAAYEHTHLATFERIYQDQVVITTQTISMIEDVDFAAETSNFVQGQILQQGAMAALSYSNRERVDQLKQLLDKIA